MVKPTSSHEEFNVTNDPQMSLLREFWKSNYARVILTAEADSLPTEMGMQQSLTSSLVKRLKEQPQNCASDLLSGSLLIWNLLH